MTTQEYMVFLLTHHHRIRADIEMLQQELSCAETADETIEALSFQAQEFGDRIQSSLRSDATARIAMVYHRENSRAIRCANTRETVERQIDAGRRAVEFLDAAFAQLRTIDCELHAAMHALYFDRITWEDYISRSLLSSTTQLSRYRKQTIELLTEWWEGTTPILK